MQKAHSLCDCGLLETLRVLVCFYRLVLIASTHSRVRMHMSMVQMHMAMVIIAMGVVAVMSSS